MAGVAFTTPSPATALPTAAPRGDPSGEWKEFKRHDSFPACNSRGAYSVAATAFPGVAGADRATGQRRERTYRPAQTRYWKIALTVNIGSAARALEGICRCFRPHFLV